MKRIMRDVRVALMGMAALLICGGYRAADGDEKSAQSDAKAVEIFVAVNGSDSWSGKLAEPNGEKTDGPFATLQRARDEIRALKIQNPKSKIQNSFTVLVRGGTYFITETMKLGAEDSGSPDAPIVYRAYKDEKPILIGGRPITGFVPYKDKILKADVGAQGFKGVAFRQLLFDGKRQILARYPNSDPKDPYAGGWASVDGQPIPMYQAVVDERAQPVPQNVTFPELPEAKRVLQYKAADARPWSRPEEGEVLIFPRFNWWNNILGIASMDRERRVLTLAKGASYEIRPGDRYFVQGLFEDLDSPGEWYLDKSTWTLYFWPPDMKTEKAGTDRTSGQSPFFPVYAPTTRTILDIGPKAAHLTFRGFTFECCEGTAITLKDAEDCLIAANTIHDVGDYGGSGVWVSGGLRNGVVGNDIYAVGKDGITMGGGDPKTLTPAGNYADNNYIHHIGVFYRQGAGVSINGVGNRASHNLIHDGPRWGIGFGGNNNIIEYNHMRHLNLETEDTGAVYGGAYNWLSSHGVVIRYNFIHDMIGFGKKDGKWTSPYFCWGIYLDWAASGMHVHGNIVARTPRAGLMVHDGRDNLVENNIFIEGQLQQAECSGWTTATRFWTSRLDDWIKAYDSVAGQPVWHTKASKLRDPRTVPLPDGKLMWGNVLRRNIFCYRNPQAKLFRFANFPVERNESDFNLIWHFGQPLRTGEFKVEKETSANLLPNPGFEEGALGEMPKDWRWQVHPLPTAKAVCADQQPHSGGRALRIEGAVNKTAPEWGQWPVVKSADVPAKFGQIYRFTVWLKSDRPDAKVSLAAQAWKANTYHLYVDKAVAVDAQWKQYELVLKFPGEGDAQYHPEMKTFYVRVAFREESGALWVDDASLNEAAAMDEWEAWKATGFDRRSVVADPLFLDLDKDDYRLRPESPAFKLGFQPIPVDKIGPYASDLRASWPIVEAEGVREKPPASWAAR